MDKQAIYDARKLGKPKMVVLGIQHMFAMFGATILVPMITGLDVLTTLLMAGLGTLLFHFITKFKVPAFLGSSFAFLGGYAAVKALAPEGADPNSMLPYACLGVACAGLVYFILAGIIRAIGVSRVMKFFPPVVTGPIIIAIGLGLAPSAVSNCTTNWFLAIVALAVIIVFNIWGKGMLKIVPIILGLLISYAVGLVLYFISQANPDLISSVPWLFSGGTVLDDAGNVTSYLPIFDFSGLQTVVNNIANGQIFGEQGLIGIPVIWNKTTFGGIDWSNGAVIASSIIAIMPISLELHTGSRSAPHPHRRRSRNHPRVALRRSREHDLRREHRRACADKGLRPESYPYRGDFCLHDLVLPDRRGAYRLYSELHHRRYLLRALRNDLRYRRAQRC